MKKLAIILALTASATTAFPVSAHCPLPTQPYTVEKVKKYQECLKKYKHIQIGGRWSDERLKENILQLEDSLEKLIRLRGVSYQWRANGQTELGVIAQEVDAQFPELISYDDEGYLRVDYGGLIPVLLESVKTLNARVEALENGPLTNSAGYLQVEEIQTSQLLELVKTLNERVEVLEANSRQNDS